MSNQIGNKLTRLRNERGLRQKEVAAVIDKKLNCYAAYEEGRSEPSLDNIFKLCKFYGVSFEYFMEENCAPKQLANLSK